MNKCLLFSLKSSISAKGIGTRRTNELADVKSVPKQQYEKRKAQSGRMDHMRLQARRSVRSCRRQSRIRRMIVPLKGG